MKEKLVRVVAPNFCAGLVVRQDRIVWAAPILRSWIGKQFGWFEFYAVGNNWKLEVSDER